MLNKVANKIALIILVLLTLSFTIFATVSYKEAQSVIDAMSKEAKIAGAISSEVFVQSYFEDNINTVETFAKTIEKKPSLLEDREALIKELEKMSTSPASNGVYVILSSTGELIAVDNKGDGVLEYVYYSVEKDNYDGRSKEYYKAAINSGKTTFASPYKDETTGKTVTTITTPMIANGKVAGAVATDVFLDDLEQLNSAKTSNTSLVLVIDMNAKKIVYHPNKDLVMSDSHLANGVVSDYMSNFEKNMAFNYSFGGEEKIAACKKYEAANWLVCSVNSLSDYDELGNKV
uniref:PDC sensor domain-containing protein n=1 Tax=Campylobacter mucosalis TaxID=202 RepID=UPI0014702CBB